MRRKKLTEFRIRLQQLALELEMLESQGTGSRVYIQDPTLSRLQNLYSDILTETRNPDE